MSRLYSPVAVLMLLVGAAIGVTAAGITLAQREQRVPKGLDRSPLSRFAADGISELVQLEALYTAHLQSVVEAAGPPPGKLNLMIPAARQIAGLDQLSLLHHSDDSKGRSTHYDLRSPFNRSQLLLRPAVAGDADHSTGRERPLPASLLFRGPDVEGAFWIDHPGSALLFCHPLGEDSVAVLTINRAALESATEVGLRSWIENSIVALRAADSPIRLQAADRSRTLLDLTDEGDAESLASPPSLVIPLASRLGHWDLVSWETYEVVTDYDPGILGASLGLAVILAATGIIVFLQQRRALKLASQQVSFANQVSHELRTPLTNILLNAELAADEANRDPHGTRERLAAIQREAERLRRLIDNVLTFSRRQQDRSGTDPVPARLAPIVDEAIKPFRPVFEQRHIEVAVSVDEELAVNARPDALIQILTNLLSNAEKYATTADRITIRSKRLDDTVALSIEDNGPGISRSDRQRVFEPFQRAQDSLVEGTSGTGLGLTISRQLAKSMGGDLILVAADGSKGARFELTLLHTSAEAPPAPGEIIHFPEKQRAS